MKADQELPVDVIYPPCLATMVSGKRYAISGSTWIEVPLDTTLDDVHKYMIWKRTKTRTEEVKTWKVEGSKGNVYKVTLSGDRWSCTCPGFRWRNSCKHIEAKKAG